MSLRSVLIICPSNFAHMNYKNIKPKSGKNPGGICSILIADINWMQDPIIADLNLGQVITPVLFKPGMDFIQLNLLQKTYSYTETPKDTKSGTYYEIAISGTLDYMNSELQQQLENLRFKQLITIVQFLPGTKKILGNKDFGLSLRFSNQNTTDNSGGLLSIPISITGNLATAPSFYNI